MKTLKQYSILAFLSLCVCTSCTKETGTEGSLSQGKGYLEVFGSIGEGYALETRADEPSTESKDRAPVDDFYSFKSTGKRGGFVDGCKIGLYSQNNTAGNFDEHRLVNTPLTYKKGENGGSFTNENIDVPSMSNLGRTFVYYPYSENNETKNEETGNNLKYSINLEYGESGPNKLPNDKNRVIDLLTAKSSGINGSGQIYYSFSHACSMLMIYRGEGFVLADREAEENDKVEVKLKKGQKAFVLSENKGDFKLSFEPDKAATNLIYPTNVFIENNAVPEKAQSINTVILPPGAEIEYIMMTDMFGTKQYIYPEQSLKLTGGKKQPVTVSLKGLDPTIFPHEITDWNDVEVTIEPKNKGVYDLDDFNNWIKAYNSTDSDRDGKLQEYGTPTDGKWTFHIYSDIEFPTETETTVQSFIPNFNDNLEGHGHTLKNISLQQQKDGTTTDANFGFVGNLNGGSINNLKIDGISVKSTTDANVGTIAGTVTSGSITNCKITGINIECEKGFAGALAGSISAGTIETCLLEGNLKLGKDAKNEAGDNSYKLFGKVDTGVTVNPEDINTIKVNVFKAGK